MPFDLMRNKKRLAQVLVVASVTAAAVYVIFILKPQLGYLASVSKRSYRIGSDIKSVNRDMADIDSLRGKIAACEGKAELYEKRLPAEEEIPSLLERLSAMAKSSGVKILSITPVPVSAKSEKARKEKIYREVPIAISAKSSYHELGRFLSQLENAESFMRVADIDIKHDKTSPKKHSIELLIMTYVSVREK